ncbi:hypothetical protein EMIT0111MI5_60152 [Burkholderia sp. IT-111MI5]
MSFKFPEHGPAAPSFRPRRIRTPQTAAKSHIVSFPPAAPSHAGNIRFGPEHQGFH